MAASPPETIRCVAIVGVGLIGGSFALALRKAGFRGRILGVSSEATLREALAGGVIDEAGSLAEAVPRADLIYLAQPVGRIVSLLPTLAPLLKDHALVTDAGSTKAEIVRTACRRLSPGQFLGGHPLAGKEVRGVAAASASLFENRTYVLTPGSPAALESPMAAAFVEWLRLIGARVIYLDAETHDRIVALTSHLPQLASTALACTLSERMADSSECEVAGQGLVDMTRLALSSHEVWGDILLTNRAAIEDALDLYIAMLHRVKDAVASGATAPYFQDAAAFAAKLRGRS